MKKLLRNSIIKIINFIDSKVFWFPKEYLKKNKINLNIYSLHSTRPKDFTNYKKLIKYIDQRSKFINPIDIENLSSNNFKNTDYSLLTFDDGYMDNYEFALTILKELNIKAIFFVIPKFILEKNKFSKDYLNKLYPGQKNKITAEIKNIFQHMNINQVENLIKEGHCIGLHGLEHEDYGKIRSIEIEEKIRQCKLILNKFKIKTFHFAYPFGSLRNFTQNSNQILSKHFKFIYTGVRGLNFLNLYKRKNAYIFKRQVLSTHKEDLVYFPIKIEELYFFSFNKIIKIFYILISTFKRIK